jgi:hypothetical protein
MLNSVSRLAVLAAVAALPVSAAATERLALAGGFTPDPWRMAFAVEGAQPAADWVRGCAGHLPAEPAAEIALANANAPLRVFAFGEGVAGVMVEGPDGVARCAPTGDEGAGYVRFERPLTGFYRIWPITAEAGAAVEGEIALSEIDLDPREVVEGPPELAYDAEPALGRHILPEEGPLELSTALEPTRSADFVGSSCSGWIDPSRPDFALDVADVEPTLFFGGASSQDLTLVVVSPAGEAFCNDDFDGLNPGLIFNDAQPGEWLVWGGVWGGERADAVLTAAREVPSRGATSGWTGDASELGLDAEPVAGVHGLPDAEPLRLDLTVWGGTSAAQFGEGCYGSLDATQPHARVTLDGPETVLQIHARGGFDGTLLVVDPDGAILCNDDYDGLNPGLVIRDAAAGDWSIFVGTWDNGPHDATLFVGREAPPSSAALDSPFFGREIGSALQALDILMNDGELRDVMTFETVEALGEDGLELTGVTLTDPFDDTPPVSIGRIVVENLDLEGLSRNGAPQRIVIRVEDLDYAALAAAAAEASPTPLPVLQQTPPMSMSFSMLPPESDPERRDVVIEVSLGSLFGVTLSADMAWPTPPEGQPAPEVSAVRDMSLEWRDGGYLGLALRAMATQHPGGFDAMLAEARGGLEAMFGGAPEGDPRRVLLAALNARLADVDRHGALKLRIVSETDLDADMIAEALAGFGQTSGFEIEAEFTPAE